MANSSTRPQAAYQVTANLGNRQSEIFHLIFNRKC